MFTPDFYLLKALKNNRPYALHQILAEFRERERQREKEGGREKK
jgi:hypothetical protein